MEGVTQHPTGIDVRRLRWREAPRMAVLAARTINREAEGRVRADGTRRPRLHRVRALYPPAPVRFYVLLIATLLDLLAVPAWVGHSPTGVAVVSEWPLTGGGRRRHHGRLLAFAAAFDALLLLVVTAALIVQPLLLAPLAAAFAPVFWPVGALLIDGFQTRSLRRTQVELIGLARGPVHYATGLAGNGPGAGHALLHALMARADAANVTVLARTEAGPLVGLYRRAGFTVAAETPTRWGTAVLLIREPVPPARGAAPTRT